NSKSACRLHECAISESNPPSFFLPPRLRSDRSCRIRPSSTLAARRLSRFLHRGPRRRLRVLHASRSLHNRPLPAARAATFARCVDAAWEDSNNEPHGLQLFHFWYTGFICLPVRVLSQKKGVIP